MFQGIVVTLIFVGATFYLGRMVYRSFQARSCASGCGRCSVIDLKKIESVIAKQDISK
jgi:hypothetical protein